MKQLIQSLRNGETTLENVPTPQVRSGHILVKSTRSLVSLGTERMLVEFGKASLISKARQQPDKVKMVLDKIQSEGLLPTMEAVFNKLAQPLPLGYCNAGKVVEVGEGVSEFKVGDRVASNGNHAEFVCIPQNLASRIPDNVSDEQASFTVIGAIALQGIRLINPTMGETVVVVGLGLIGLMAAQLLKANGCQVIAYDLDHAKISIAKSMGIDAFNSGDGIDPVKSVNSKTGGIGADAVVITASDKGNVIISQSARMSRKRGRMVLVGVIGLDISRADFYEKELSFQVSCSYGPGRYDPSYELKGIDYPLPFVRWTEKRNFETILSLISNGGIDVDPLVTERVLLENFKDVYGGIGKSKSIATVLQYSSDSEPSKIIETGSTTYKKSKGTLGIVGAGNFTKMTLLPTFKSIGASVKYIASGGGLNGTALAKKFNIAFSTTDYEKILEDDEVDLVVITTQHNLHKEMVVRALLKGKHVFVEKPLALDLSELSEIEEAYRNSGVSLTVGFNRRFSPHIIKIKKALGQDSVCLNVIATMNAGFIPQDVWVQDMKIGGGRIIGEACHHIDLITHLCGSKVASVCINAMGQHPEENSDNVTILLKYENGTNGVINYFANGSKAYSKERLEIYYQEQTIVMDNFRVTKGFGVQGFSKLKTGLDKGHKNQFAQLIKRIEKGEGASIPFEEIVNTSKASFAAIESLKRSSWINVNEL